jgi:hypothetical protein
MEHGPFSPFYRLSANTANAECIKAGVVDLGYLECFNIGTARAYVKLYDKATAPAATDTPKMVIALPAGPDGQVPAHLPLKGVRFWLGLGIRIVTGIADSDNTSVPANEIIVNGGMS